MVTVWCGVIQTYDRRRQCEIIFGITQCRISYNVWLRRRHNASTGINVGLSCLSLDRSLCWRMWRHGLSKDSLVRNVGGCAGVPGGLLVSNGENTIVKIRPLRVVTGGENCSLFKCWLLKMCPFLCDFCPKFWKSTLSKSTFEKSTPFLHVLAEISYHKRVTRVTSYLSKTPPYVCPIHVFIWPMLTTNSLWRMSGDLCLFWTWPNIKIVKYCVLYPYCVMIIPV
jgi:hypothetical protein